MNDFEFCNEIGCRYQDILAHELLRFGISLQCHTSKLFQLKYGESVNLIECKHDAKIVETGNLFIEFSAINKNGDKMIDGGIEKVDDSWLYLIGNGRCCYIFAKNQLKSLLRSVKQDKDKYAKSGIFLKARIDKDTKQITSYGIVIPTSYAMDRNLCIKYIEFEKDYTKWLC